VTVADHDVVVIGAGPAGSATAISLAERGWRVLLVDKATFPRDKVCGDFVSPRSLAVLTQLGCWDDLRRAQPQSIRKSILYLNGELISSGSVPQVGDLPGFGMVIPRLVLDEIIFRRAAAAGAETVEGFTATDLSVGADGITVLGRTAHGPSALSARLVVVADGARSRIAAGRGIPAVSSRRDPFALRAYLRDVPSAPDTAAVFFDAAFFPGFAWVFPTGNGGANAGIGMPMDVSRRYGINLRDRFVHWLQHDRGLRDMLGGTSTHGRIVGWPLTSYQSTHGNYAERTLLVGDAGRFIDPINGEGIHTALESARIAASVADEALTRGELGAASLSVYERRWRAQLDLDLRTSDLMATAAKNRALLPVWLLIIRMVAQRSMDDPEFAASCGGIMAGVLPSHRGMSLELMAKAAIQRPEFWLRHQSEVRRAMTALMLPGIGGRRDLADQSEFAMDWLRDVLSKSAAVSAGLSTTYGVPWVSSRRPQTPRPTTPRQSLPKIVLRPVDRDR
jgi:geranylgeranyl reductase family protein